MKKADRILLVLPLLAETFLILLGVGFHLTFRHLMQENDRRMMASLEQKAGLTAQLVDRHLQEGDLSDAIAFCRNFDNRIFRLTLIAPDGQVLADSEKPDAKLDNHQDRAEVKTALTGQKAFSKRYSGTLEELMVYCAWPLAVGRQYYVLRMAVPVNDYDRLLQLAGGGVLFFLCAGAILLGLLEIYLLRNVYRPLDSLQLSARQLAAGRLDVHIPVPESGIVRELACDISAMAEQLKEQLRHMTRERNEKEFLLDAMSEAVLLWNQQGELIEANRAARQLFAIPDDLDQFHLARIGIPELLLEIREAFQGKQCFAREFELVREGVALTVFIQGRILDEGQNKRLLLTVTDLSKQRKLESFRSDFIANVSHEIKTPLTCIIGAAEALEESPELSGEQRARLFEMLIRQSRRLNMLVQDILSLAALEKRQREPRKDFVSADLAQIVENAVKLCGDRARAANVELNMNLTAHPVLPGDPALLEQAVVNLISNALKYSNSATVDVALSEEERHAVIEVKDYGIGITPEHAARIFERFYRVDQARSRELGGTGLGLAIVKHVANLHGGTAEVESQPGLGAAFRIVLPV